MKTTRGQSSYIFLFCSLLLAWNLSLSQCISTFPYVEDFESAPSWTAVSVANSDWAWGTPNHTYVIHSAGSGSKCWSVGGLTGAFYNFWEQSYVVSPCFNFTNLQYPHIKFKLFYDSEYHFDGGNLQYSTNGGTTWTNVGAYNDPVDCNTQNWYNYNSINYLNNPAWISVKHGWCGNSQAGGTGWDPANPGVSCVGGNGPGQWVTAEHCLTGLGGQPSVMLRFTFGAGYTCNNFDGFAFDSVAISNGIPNSANFTHACGSGTTLNFTSTYAPCPVTNAWAWNFGDPASGASNTSALQSPSHTFSGPGTYTVTMIASGGACNPPDTVTQVVTVMTASVTSLTNVSCNGGTNGSATISVNPAAAAPSYTWSPSGGNSSTATGLSAGTYSLAISSASACPVSTVITITQPPALTATSSQTNVSCYGGTNGVGIVTASGGTSAYTYSWSPSGGNSASASGLTAGNYTCTVTDAHNCQASQAITITQPSSLTLSASTTSASCSGNNGTGTASVSGGTSPYTYTWSPSGGNAANASGLAGGTYTVSVTDASGCPSSTVVSVTQPITFTVSTSSTSVTCNGGNNGSAAVSVTGGASPLSYSWSPSGGNTTNASNLQAGNYSVIITDANGCSQTKTVAITQPSAVTITTNSLTLCNGQNGTLTANASGGTPPYTYSWNNAPAQPANTFPVSGTVSATYTVSALDANLCPSPATVAVVQVLPALEVNTGDASTCAGQSTTLTATATGGNGNYAFSWQPGGMSGSSISIAPVTTTIYTVTVSDGCTVANANDTGMVSVSAVPVFSLPSGQSGCAPQCLTFSVTNTGNNVVAWQWNFGDNSTSASPTASHCYTSPGTYNASLTYTTTQGCVNTIHDNSPVTVYSAPIADFSASTFQTDEYNSDISFYDQSTGATHWSWSFGDSATSSSQNPDHLYISSGTYVVTLAVVNQHGCVDTISRVIKILDDFTFYAPNTFTPNSDGVNDSFIPTGVGWDLPTYKLWIFDRWGNMIFSTSDAFKGWNGCVQGHNTLVQQDVYVWKVSLKDIFDKYHDYIGHITVLR